MADFNFEVSSAPVANLGRRLTFTPDGHSEIDLGKYAPGFESNVQGRWGHHPIPGQRGDLKEDLGDGSLQTRVQLQFVGDVANDYYEIVGLLTSSRRGILLHPRRGSRPSIVASVSERVEWTTQGNETTIVDIVFEDATLNTGGQFAAGPSSRAQQVLDQGQAAQEAADTIQARALELPDVTARQRAAALSTAVTASTTAASAYASAAVEAYSLGTYGPDLVQQLRALPPLVSEAQATARLTGTAADIQATSLALEVMLFAATQLDAAIQAAQPIPVRTTVTRQPGQNIYAFVQQHYGRSGKSPADMRALVRLILRLNPQIRRPSLIPSGVEVVRPAA